MKNLVLLIITSFVLLTLVHGQHLASNPIIHADVPDPSIVRVGNTYYMSSTTMHMNPGVPIMKSKDMVNWELVNYAYDTLGNNEALNLENGQNAYGRGSWASCLRYVNNTYYVSTFSSTTGKTYIYSTKDIEKGPWEVKTFQPSYHDHTIFFDDDGKIYMIWGVGKLSMVELKNDLSGVKEGTERVLIENASEPAKARIMLPAEGSQLFKIKGKYYLFNICWPRGGMRSVIIHRADKITGPYEGRLALQDKGVAQGGLIDTPDGRWFAYLFQDHGAVGRIPYLTPVKWEDDWPVLGEEGKVPANLNLPASDGLIPGIVHSDDFMRRKKDSDLPLVWQWNHNPQAGYWSVRERIGFMRITTSQIDGNVLEARNTLTQRTIGPESSGSTSIDVSKMNDGDVAGLIVLQEKYGFVGVENNNGNTFIIMINADSGEPKEVNRIPLSLKVVHLRADCNFKDRADVAKFYYSLDGESWTEIGSQMKMQYTLAHFMGYRFGLFNYATKSPGGYVDFDYFNIEDAISEF